MPGCEIKKDIHVRVKSPSKFHKDSFRTIRLSKDVKGVIGCPLSQGWDGKRCKGGTRLQKKIYKNTAKNRSRCRGGKWTKKS